MNFKKWNWTNVTVIRWHSDFLTHSYIIKLTCLISIDNWLEKFCHYLITCMCTTFFSLMVSSHEDRSHHDDINDNGLALQTYRFSWSYRAMLLIVRFIITKLWAWIVFVVWERCWFTTWYRPASSMRLCAVRITE